MLRDVQWTGGYAPRFQAFFSALGFFRFDSESQPTHLPLTLTISLRVATRILQMKTQTLIAAVFLILFGIHRNVNLYLLGGPAQLADCKAMSAAAVSRAPR